MKEKIFGVLAKVKFEIMSNLLREVTAVKWVNVFQGII